MYLDKIHTFYEKMTPFQQLHIFWSTVDLMKKRYFAKQISFSRIRNIPEKNHKYNN
jgi:hypothetical protein